MKKFILFLFLVTSFSIHSAKAQDIGDEFVDPTLSNSNPDAMTPPQGFETSTTQPPPIDTNANQPFENSVQTQTLPAEENSLHAQSIPLEEPGINSPEYGDVIVEQQTNLYQPYKQRRGKHGVLLSVNYEKFYPKNYYSMYRDQKIEQFLGSTAGLEMFSGEIGYKYNFKLGSLALLANYAHGSTANSKYNADGIGERERNLEITRYGLSINCAADALMDEPWIVPYGQIGLHQFEVTEDDLAKEKEESTTTGISLNYKVGLLFQLNWIERAIDPSTQADGLRSSGLQNTYIDIFAMTHMPSTEVYDAENPTGEGDPNLQAEMQIGAGLKIEF